MIFEKGRTATYPFFINDMQLEIVYFKYLRITLIKMVIGQGNKYVLLSAHLLHYLFILLFNHAEFTFLKKFYLFVTLVY